MSRPKTVQPAVDTATRTRLVDEMVERYVDWREECAAVEEAYRCWSTSSAPCTMEFAIYNAALDREECAARLYAGALSRLKRCLWLDLELDPSLSGAG